MFTLKAGCWGGKKSLPSRISTPSPGPVHEIWKQDELYTTPVHLTCQISHPTPLCCSYRSLDGSTPVPQCDKSLMPHLGAPTESFSRDVLLINLIFHAVECLTPRCGLQWLGGSQNVHSLICHCLIAFVGRLCFRDRYWFEVELKVILCFTLKTVSHGSFAGPLPWNKEKNTLMKTNNLHPFYFWRY